ncbi:hypothetical protein J7K60_02975 [Candidatus Bipolaricaulota bacterium]|nr:hypothetical protein [Candidatus Bipolaricaulota bacterium]HHR85334.1 hypothetical protein [Candidatus Acetothermia bacterium]
MKRLAKTLLLVVMVVSLFVAIAAVTVSADPIHVGGGRAFTSSSSPIHVGGGRLLTSSSSPIHVGGG